jgi:hypothetical protein
VDQLLVTDLAGNTQSYSASQLAASGFPSILTVTSTSDTTPPTLSAFSFSPTSVNVTAHSAAVTVSFSVQDNLSGAITMQAVFVSPSAITQTASSSFAASTSFTGTAALTIPAGSENGVWTVGTVLIADAAGNTTTLGPLDLIGKGFPTQLTVIDNSADTTPPVIIPTVTPAPGATGWNTTTPVTVSWSVTDPESGIASSTGCGTITLATQTTGTTLTCTASNGAGLSASASVVVKIDLTPPIVSANITPAPNAAGWNNTNATVTWTATDQISGINITLTNCPPVTLTAETAGTTLSCTAVDNAGLSTTAKVTVKIDKTAPVATAAATPPPNAAGWNNTNVTVTFTGTDNLSGIASCSAPAVLTTDGTGLSATGTCTDNAGNVSAPATIHVNIDKTPPVISGMPAASCSLWPPNGKLVQVATVTAADATSGIVLGSFQVTGTSSEPQSDPNSPDIVITPTGSGGYSVQLRADRNGNGPGRVYTLTGVASDNGGNQTKVTASCTVPHDQGNGN